MEYNFYSLTPLQFEQLVQSLFQKVLGNNSLVFGVGPDGGRELTFTGKSKFPSEYENWEGNWIVQAKYKMREFEKTDNYTWVAKNLKEEINKFITKQIPFPDNYILVTNAVLSPTYKTGARDKIEALKQEYTSLISHILIISHDELCSLIDNNRDVATAYAHLLTAGDVLQTLDAGLKALLASQSGINQSPATIGEIRGPKITWNRLVKFKTPLLCIDFGTSYSIAALLSVEGKIEFIPDAWGKKLIPSVITFFENGSYLIGHPEYSSTDSEKQFTLTNIKRYLGSEREFKFWNKTYKPEEIVSLIVCSLKKNAEEYLGCNIEDVLISKPANFNKNEANSLTKSFQLAGLKIRRAIDEPSVASLVYEMNNISFQEQDVIIAIDLGGGTLDMVIMEYSHIIFEIKSIIGDNALGGIDYDEAIYRYALEEINSQKHPMDQHLLNWLLYESERVKKELTKTDRAHIIVPGIQQINGEIEDFVIEISKEKFDELTKNITSKIKDYIDKLFFRMKRYLLVVESNDIKAVLLTGQGTRIRPVRELISEYFPKIPIIDRYCENAVITGLTEYSGVLLGMNRDKLLLNVHNMRIALKCKLMLHTYEEGKVDGVISENKIENTKWLPIIGEDNVIPTRRMMTIMVENSNAEKVIPVELFEFSNSDHKSYCIADISIPLDAACVEFTLELTIDENGTVRMTVKSLLTESVPLCYQLNNFYIVDDAYKRI